MARTVAIGFPHHVTHRGNNKETILGHPEDKNRYLSFLHNYSTKWRCSILACCLMDNHVHLLVRPTREQSLFKTMQGVAQAYSKYANNKYGRTGRLWECRYYSCVVDREDYLWAVLRYIEQNPLRAGMTAREEDYLYSSAGAHILGKSDPILHESIIGEDERKPFEKFVHDRCREDELKKIRCATKTGKPLGSSEFIRDLEKRLNREIPFKSPGRPRKN